MSRLSVLSDGPAFESENLKYELIKSFKRVGQAVDMAKQTERKNVYQVRDDLPDNNKYIHLYQTPLEIQSSLNMGAMNFGKRPSYQPVKDHKPVEYDSTKIISGYDELSSAKKPKCFVDWEK